MSPVLFSVYTNELMCNNAILTLIKFADDMALVARLKDELSLANYFLYVDTMKSWFDTSFLELNVRKTKEMCLMRGRKQNVSLCQSLNINGEEVENVNVFKYLGTILDSNLSFTDNVDYIVKKAQQRFYLLRKLNSFNVSKDILTSVYRSLIESVMVFNIVSWYGNISVKNRTRLTRLVNMAGRVIGIKQKQLSELYSQSLQRKATQIFRDKSHPLHSRFQILHSGRRLKVPLAKKNCYKKSFIPSAISILNTRLPHL